MYKFIILLVCGLTIFSCSKESVESKEQNSLQVLSADHSYLPAEIPDLQNTEPLGETGIYKTSILLAKELEQEFEWSMVDDYTFWSSVKAGESSLISIGFKKDVPVYKGDPSSTKDQLLKFLVSELQKKNLGEDISIADLKPQYFKYIDAFFVEVDDYEILGKLRRLESIRYVEPESFDLEFFITPDDITKATGCGGEGVVFHPYHSRPYSYNNTSQVAWQFDANNVYRAWDHSRKGSGVTIASTDTGISNQPLLGSQFSTGESSGRTINKYATISGGTNDQCGHGTTMAGQMTGPLNNQWGLVGSAYKANLDAYRVSNDVYMNKAWERHAWARAVEDIVEKGDAKIISVAMGRSTQSGVIEDAADLAHNEDLLMICAAGSAGLSMYPAKYSNTIAVTVVKYRPNQDPSGTALQSYFYGTTGSFVDFCVYMKHDDHNIYGAGMRRSNHQLRNARGSSAGVATVSGIAAMILSNGPWYTKQNIIDKMTLAASISPKSSTFGHGIIDAEAAVRSVNSWVFDRDITGPPVVNRNITYDYDFNSNTPKTFFVRDRQPNTYQWINNTTGLIKFTSPGKFEVCSSNAECTDCMIVTVN